MADFVPKQDSEMRSFADKVVVAVVAAPLIYGSTAADATALDDLRTSYVAALAASDASKNAQTASVAAKEDAKTALVDAIRKLNAKVQLSETITDAQRLDAGLPIRDMVRSSNTPVVPAALVATPGADGTNNLVWNGGANTSGIKYVVERRKGATADFELVDVVTATKYAHKNQKPGEAQTYRVRARRGDVTSGPSNTANVYS